MARPKSLQPKYRFHKSSGQAYVVIDGRDCWLGAHDSPESWRRYHALLAEWAARGHQGAPSAPAGAAGGAAAPGPTVSMIVAGFWRHARGYYHAGPDGRSGELGCYRQVLRVLRHLYGGTPAAEFGPLKLKALRAYVVRPHAVPAPEGGGTRLVTRPGWSRNYANAQVGRVKSVFRWAVGEELVPAGVDHGLRAVGPLLKGRSEARETAPVAPVPEGLIDPVRARVSPQVRALIDLQLLAGARPGELCVMRTGDVDRSGKEWVYRPGSHKTAHRGHTREVFIGPRAQAVLLPFLNLAAPDAYCFSPADAERARAERLRAARKTTVQPSQVRRAARARRRRRRRAPTDRYDVAAYRRAIARACDRAFPPPEPLARRKGETAAAWRARLTPEQAAELARWVRDHRWHPHQLRHNAATRLRRERGIEAAQEILGHRTLRVTEVYAERDGAAARKIMGEVG